MTVRDNWPDERATGSIHVEYGDDLGPIVLKTDGETVEYTWANNPECIEEGMMSEPADRNDSPTVELELHVDTGCEDYLSGVDL